MPRPRKVTDEQVSEAIGRIAAGERVMKVAESYGVTVSALYQRATRLGLRASAAHRAWSFPGRIIMPTEPTVLAYVAGLFDGEGSLVCDKRGPKWAAVISMTDEKVIAWLAAQTSTSYGAYPSYHVGHAPSFRWSVGSRRDLVAFLQGILPYMVTKREKAELVLDATLAHLREDVQWQSA